MCGQPLLLAMFCGSLHFAISTIRLFAISSFSRLRPYISSAVESIALFPFAKIFLKWTSPVDLYNLQQHKTASAVAL